MNTKLFQDIKTGDTIYWQEYYSPKEGVRMTCFAESGIVLALIHNKDNTITLCVERNIQEGAVDGKYMFHIFDVHSCVNIDYYDATEQKKFIIGTNRNELMAFLNAPYKCSDEDIIESMRQHISDCIDKDICDRLKEEMSPKNNKKWYDKFLKLLKR